MYCLSCIQHISPQDIFPSLSSSEIHLEEDVINPNNNDDNDRSPILPDGVNEGLYDGEGYAFYEHPIEPDPEPIMCYSCHYSKTKQHEQGLKNCDEPFNVTGIPMMSCKGSCATTRTTFDGEDYMLIRSCLLDCHNMSEVDSSVECCNRSKCNGRVKPPGYLLEAASLGALGFVLIAGVLCSMCYNKM